PGAGISITFTPATSGASGASGAFNGGNTVITNASGTATANPLQANTIAGNHTVVASFDGSNVNFNLTNNPDAVNNLAITAGNNQSTTVNTAFTTDLKVTVTDQFGNVIPNAAIAFNAPSAGASLNSLSQSITTDANGIATLTAIANTVAGGYTVQAESNNINADFSLTNLADVVANLDITGGDNQATTVNTTFADNLAIRITDQFGNPISDATITLTAPSTGASGTPASTTLTTDSNGFATVSLTANGFAGNYVILVNVDGIDGSTISLTNNLDTDTLQYLDDYDRDPIDPLTSACQTLPAAELELEFPLVEREDLGMDEMIGLNERCLPVGVEQ
ncbi:MAG TPA: Ig-like domain-containing protein, partial [Anaerolineae bacterium]|nr:Ig-like domain-containing protein [Anaerolineae bacterium]